jgi:branched-chain amino acid transport system ATP-binding protein
LKAKAAGLILPRGTVNAAREVTIRLEDVHTFYGSIQALKGISLEVRKGEIVTLIGAHGPGKSTTLRSINGLNTPSRASTSRAAPPTTSSSWGSRSPPRGGGSFPV